MSILSASPPLSRSLRHAAVATATLPPPPLHCRHLSRANPPPPCCPLLPPPPRYTRRLATTLPPPLRCLHHCRAAKAAATPPPPRYQHRHAVAAIAFVLSLTLLPLHYCTATAGCHRHAIATAALPTAASQPPHCLPPPRCHHLCKAVAAVDVLPLPPPCCRRHCCLHFHHCRCLCRRHCYAATALLPTPTVTLPATAPLTPLSPRRCHRHRCNAVAATTVLPPPPPPTCYQQQRHHPANNAAAAMLPLSPLQQSPSFLSFSSSLLIILSGVVVAHLFLFSFNFNSYVCFYVGSVCTVLLSYSCDVLEPITEEQ